MKKVRIYIYSAFVVFAVLGCQSFTQGNRGQIEQFNLPNPLSDESTFNRMVSVYLPPGYEKSEADFPLLILLNDQNYGDHTTFPGSGYPKPEKLVGKMHINRILDSLIAEGRVAPMVVAMPDFKHLYRENSSFYPYVAETLPSFLRETYRIADSREQIAIAGHSWSANEAIEIAMLYESLFSAVAAYGLCRSSMPIPMLIEKYYDRNNPVRFHVYLTDSDLDLGTGGSGTSDLARRYVDVLIKLEIEALLSDFDGDYFEALPEQVEKSLVDIFGI